MNTSLSTSNQSNLKSTRDGKAKKQKVDRQNGPPVELASEAAIRPECGEDIAPVQPKTAELADAPPGTSEVFHFASDDCYKRLVAQMSVVVLEMTPEGIILFANGALADVLGYTSLEVEGKSWREIFNAVLNDALFSLLAAGDIAEHAVEFVCKSGSPVTLQISSANYYAPDGTLVRILLSMTDVTARQMEENIVAVEHMIIESESRLVLAQRAATLDALPAQIAVLDPDGIVVAVNEAWRHFVNPTAFAGQCLPMGSDYLKTCDTFANDDAAAGLKIAGGLRSVLERRIERFEIEYRCSATTSPHWFRLIVTPLQFEGTFGAIVTHVDVTESRIAAQSALDSEERLQRAIHASNVGLWDWNFDTNEVNYLPKEKNHLGVEVGQMGNSYEEWAGRLHPDDRDRTLKAVGDYVANPDHPYSQVFRLRHDDGSYRWFLVQGTVERDTDGRPVRMLGSHIDITDQKRLEEEFIQAQKMESVGRLAGGIAHDFNNLLTVIGGYSDFALLNLPPGDDNAELIDDLNQINRAAARAATLTTQLLAFSRRQVLRPETLALNQIIIDSEKMLRRLIGEDIDVVLRLGEKLGQVTADPGQMEQVIMNLAINARDAMPKGGRLIIETCNTELDELYASTHFDAMPGNYVQITVSDSGLGMDKHTREHLFEPFFTTKELGKGTGLGLATVYGIVKQSGGGIWVYSELGKGTTFKIYLPRVDDAVVMVSKSMEPNALASGDETILLVEDEEALRVLTERILVRLGYTVLSAANGADAIALMAQQTARVDLVLTDVIMPGISGKELSLQLMHTCPGLKVLYMSGYTDTAISAHGVLEKGTELINKPYTASQIAQKVREVLNREAISF